MFKTDISIDYFKVLYLQQNSINDTRNGCQKKNQKPNLNPRQLGNIEVSPHEIPERINKEDNFTHINICQCPNKK